MAVVHWMAEKSLVICGALLVEFARNLPSRVPGAAAAAAGQGALLPARWRAVQESRSKTLFLPRLSIALY